MADASNELIKAAKSGDAKRVKELLGTDGALVNVRDKEGSTPLHYAAWKGNYEIVKLLLDAGADVSAHNRNEHWGTTPLHAAAHANQAKIAELLIEHGADLNAQDSSGRTPMYHTSFHKATAAANVLRKHGAG